MSHIAGRIVDGSDEVLFINGLLMTFVLFCVAGLVSCIFFLLYPPNFGHWLGYNFFDELKICEFTSVHHSNLIT